MKGIERSIAALANEGVGWVALGVVTEAEAHSSLGYLLTITLQPSGRQVQARLAGRRFLLAAEVDDEVLVMFPDGDQNRGVAFPAELVSSAAPLPSSWSNGGPQIVDADGLQIRTSESASIQKVVTEDILPRIAGMATTQIAITGALAAFGITITPTDASQLAAMTPTQYRTAALQSE